MSRTHLLLALLLAGLSTAARCAPLTGDAGVGLSYQPSEPAGSHYETKPMPYLDLTWGDVGIDSDEGLTWAALKTGNGWSAGPLANLVEGRNGNDRLRGLRDVPDMVELGGFVQYSPVDFWRVYAQAGRAEGGGHGQGGTLGRLGTELDYPLGGGVFGATELVAHFADQRMNQTFFGVDANEAQASGIGAYRASGGLQNWTLSQGAQFPLGGHWSLLANVDWIHLEGSAADSSIVSQRGHVNQGEVQTAVAYKF
ncbi:MipA/OmpV family protein [Pseudomonas sp. RIT-To-2]|uniref:MipA/OmpV family protein n=1 Tax=Pseudomonas sp. RIT-To-2 TaxID=3462541 RepID=UPI0024137D0A